MGTDILLIPQPSDDPNDPLNWPQWKKGAAFITIQIFTFLSIWILGGIGAALILIIHDFRVDLTGAVRGLVSWMVLTIGLAVIPLSRVLTEFYRTSFGFPCQCTSAAALASSWQAVSSSQRQCGKPCPLHGMELHGRRPRYRWFCRCSRRGSSMASASSSITELALTCRPSPSRSTPW